MLAPMRTLVVVPTYNEAAGHRDGAAPHPRATLPDGEILVVDDNSPDGTADLVEAGRRATSGMSRAAAGRRRPASAAPTCAGFAEGLDAASTSSSRWTPTSPTIRRSCRRWCPRPTHGADLAIGSRYVPGGSIAGLDVAPGVPLAVGQPVRRARRSAWP